MTKRSVRRANRFLKKAHTAKTYVLCIGLGVIASVALISMIHTALDVRGYITSHIFELQSPIKVTDQKTLYNDNLRKFMAPSTRRTTPTPKIQPSATPGTTIAPFKKYLTPQGASARTTILNMIEHDYANINDQVAFDNILKKEAGYRADATNEIGACGMGQALPCSKMPCELTYSTQAIRCQYEWIKAYINRRYGTPQLAWRFHLNNNWY